MYRRRQHSFTLEDEDTTPTMASKTVGVPWDTGLAGDLAVVFGRATNGFTFEDEDSVVRYRSASHVTAKLTT